MLSISLPLTAEKRILALLRKLWVLPVDIGCGRTPTISVSAHGSYSHVGAGPDARHLRQAIADWDSVAKRCFDIFFSLRGLALLWPVMLAAAVAGEGHSPGPIIFKQHGHGFNNETIEVYKFRSMYTHMSDPTARNAVTKNDPRVTPVGRFLRKFFDRRVASVLQCPEGELSLVGPRPPRRARADEGPHYSDVVEGYFAAPRQAGSDRLGSDQRLAR